MEKEIFTISTASSGFDVGTDLQFLLVNGEVAGLDVEQAASAEAQHVLVTRVPRHAVRVRLLRENAALFTTVQLHPS